MKSQETSTPKSIKRIEDSGLEVTWRDGTTSIITSATLRANCPSAESKAQRGDTTHDKPLIGGKKGLSVISHTREESLRLVKIWPVGKYAIGIEWGDNLKSGIYSFDLLKELAQSGEQPSR
jgi:DUF971 family protein